MKAKDVGKDYSANYWKNWPEIVEDLDKKIKNNDHFVTKEKVNNIFRMILAYNYIKMNYPQGATILDMGCGIGYNSCFLQKEGYKVIAFDISEEGIKRAKQTARNLDVSPDIFHLADHTFLGNLQDKSIDVALAMGYIYYLEKEQIDFTYYTTNKILKDNGSFILALSNDLFDLFSLNDTSLKQWTKIIDSFSPVKKLLPNEDTLEALRSKVKVPKRIIEPNSISARYGIIGDNPLTYSKDVEKYGFSVESIKYPDNHLLPPFLESEVNEMELLKLKAKYCVQQADAWQGIFLNYEFLAFLKKIISK